ncbi:MAG: iron uptake porin, partial [Synechococcus sp. MOX_bin13]|nr:iron uptake porin [Synechococcus sp. MOX_bin13]
MKLFQQLLVAPAALGLLATGANAAELNINGVSDYAASADQVTSVTQFSDVYPTDWAYQALAGLVETYGCVAGYPNGTFRGNRAMTRFEAAALLNACLDRVTEVTDELRRLMAEFETELAILKGRVDGLEARVGELEATQFSTTTKLKGYTAWVLGALDGIDGKEATTLNYDLRLKLATSFTGKDQLTTVLRSGNFNKSIFGTGLTFVETAMGSKNSVKVGRLFYTFPVGDSLSVTAGPIVRT